MAFQELKKIPEIIFFLYLTIFLTSRFGTLLHEVVGHGLSSVILGGNITGVSINLFTTGSCSYQVPDSGLVQRAIVDLAGIAVNLVTGIIALIMLKRIKLQLEIRIILSVFAVVSIGSQITYLVMGSYYGHGDPLIFEELLGSMKWLVWMVFLILLAPSTYFLADAYLWLQEEMFPSDTLRARAGILFSTLIAASVLYGACFYAEDRGTGFAGGMAASERMIAEQAEKVVEGQFLTEDERISRVEVIKKQLRPFPIIIPILWVGFFSALLAFLKTRDRPSPTERKDFVSRFLWWSLYGSLVVGGIIVLV